MSGKLRQIHTAIATGFGSLLMGALNVWPSYTLSIYRSNDTTPLLEPMTQGEESLLGSLPSLGAMLGTAISGPLLNMMGRRNGGVLLTLPFVLSWAIISIASTANLVLAARFLSGVSGGAFLIVAPLFISEVSEDSIRGALASAPIFLYTLGTVFSYGMGSYLTYSTIIWLNMVLSMISTLLMVIVVESPVYLLRKKRDEDARLAIAKYRGVSASSMVVSDELSKLKQQITPSIELISVTDTDTKADESEKEKLHTEDVAPEISQRPISPIKLLFISPISRRAFIVLFSIITLQVFMGIVPVQVYAKTVFMKADASHADMYTILFAVVMFCGAGTTTFIADLAGRKILLITSAVLASACMTALGFLINNENTPAWVTVFLILTYCFTFMLGAGSIPYVLMAEIFVPEITVTLITRNLSIDEQSYLSSLSSKSRNRRLKEVKNKMGVFYQVLGTVMICTLCFNMGIVFTWPATIINLFGSSKTTLDRPMTEREVALLGSLSSIGALVCTPIVGLLLDRLGRKYCSLISALGGVVNWTIILATNKIEVVLTGVFLSGISICSFLIASIYISEICQASIRGAMTTCATVAYGLGSLFTFLMGGYLKYNVMLYVCLSAAIIAVGVIMLMKDSPIYLMTKGREKAAARSIAFFRNLKVDSKEVLEEINHIRRTLNPKLDDVSPEEEKLKPDSKPKEKLSLWQFLKLSQSTRRALFVNLVIVTLAIFQGLVVLQIYAETLFQQAIPNVSPTICSAMLAGSVAISGLFAAYLTDRAGRRPLMILSSMAVGICCLVLGSQIHVHWGPDWITAIFMYLFPIIYTFGGGTVPFVLLADLYLPEVKSFASMLVMEWTWICCFIILFIFNPLLNTIGLGPVFYIFAAICFLTSVFCIIFLPETKGLPVDIIQTLFTKKKALGLC